MERIEFDESKHAYSIGGTTYPSVTEICEPISFKKLDAISKTVIDNAARRGGAVHELICDFLAVEELPNLDEVDGSLYPYFVAFIEWWRTYRPTTLFSEFVIGNSELGYCGTCDFVCVIDGKIVLIDFKTTSQLDKKYLAVQLAGYKRLLEKIGVKVEQTCVLHLKKDGTYTYKEIEPDYEWFDLLLEHNKKMRRKAK